MEVRFEALVTDTTNVLKDICNFIDLPYAGEMERYFEKQSEKLKKMKPKFFETHKYLGQPPAASRIGRYKSEMTDEQRSIFEGIAGPMLRDLGYTK
jgi:hypothetical protein